MRNRLFGRALATLSLAILAAALVFALVSGSLLSRYYAEANELSLSRAATALAATFPEGALADEAAASRYAKLIARGGYRATLILTDGRVVADSEADAKSMENHGSRPEVAAAIGGSVSVSRRKSATVGEELIYAAAPIWRAETIGRDATTNASPGGIEGVLRLALHMPTLNKALAPARGIIGAAALAFVAAAIAAAAAFSRMTTRPLAALAEVAKGYGSGRSLSTREGELALGRDDPEEMLVLGRTLDSMAAEISARVAEARAQGRELEAILDAMSEAVLALDSQLRIRIANPAARDLFDLGEKASGRLLLEATRSSSLQEVAAACLDSRERKEAEISLFLPSSAERIFQAFATPLRSGDSADSLAGAGVVVVLGDITALRRLERVRRDFVANVSHELRTPVQLVKGFSETILDSSADDPEQTRRFVGIIERNAGRMESLIADLLSLASLERGDSAELKKSQAPIAPILEGAREAIQPKAEARGTGISVDCEPSLEARVEPGLLEQAVVNLVDNAVKYSPPKTSVRVRAWADSCFLVIEVRDQGIGIPASDLARIFERFYRVDKARSRELGGTGLGLAIVKHIAMAHGGDVSVESYEGEGSTFRIRIPL